MSEEVSKLWKHRLEVMKYPPLKCQSLTYQVDPLVQHSYPVKDDHFFCPCICNLILEVREGPSKCVKPSPCVMYIQMPANNDSYLRRHFCTLTCSYLNKWCLWRGLQIMKTLIGSDEVSSLEVPILELSGWPTCSAIPSCERLSLLLSAVQPSPDD